MPAADYLRSARDDGYGAASPPKKTDSDDPKGKNDPDEPNNTSRIIKLSDEEQKSLMPYNIKPGEEVILEISGNLEKDGHFHVMSAKYAEGKSSPKEGSEMEMANQVMSRLTSGAAPIVRPQLQPSPS